jgi:hypothetical protein
MFMLVAWGATFVLGFSGIFVWGLLIPPPLKRVQGKPFEKTVSLHLSDKSESDKRIIR